MATTCTRLIKFAGYKRNPSSPKADVAIMAKVRKLVEVHGRLPIAIQQLDDRDNLFAAGLRSFAAVQLFMAIEDCFEVEVKVFDKSMSIVTISDFVSRLVDMA